MNRQIALKSINEMPKKFELDELFERLLVIEKIQRGLDDVENNRTFTHTEAKEKLGKWLK